MNKSFCNPGVCKLITQQCHPLHNLLLEVANQPREEAESEQKPWPIPFLQACADQKAAPATQKHRENTLEESVFASAEHSNFPKQPREKAEAQPTDQLCGLIPSLQGRAVSGIK